MTNDQRPTTTIKFGTDGWRGIIADDFTFENVRRVAAAIAAYVRKDDDPRKGIVVGYDTRFASPKAARVVAETIAAAGIPVTLATDYTPTPGVSFAVRHFNAAGGVVVTSSHNPWNWNGLKFKAKYAGPATPAIMKAIEGELNAAPVSGSQDAAPKTTPSTISEADFKQPYVDAMCSFVDMARIKGAGFKFAVDPMHGAGRGILKSIFARNGIDHLEIRGELNPLFPGINPEPIEPHIKLLQETVVREKCHAGFATDGDADRIGAVDEHGAFVDSHKIFAILLRWLVERKQWPGAVAKTFSTTKMLDKIAAKHKRKLFGTAIGFKYICDLMLAEDILIGGEESGGIGITRHLPERDGSLNALLLAAVMAEEGKTLAQLVDALQSEYGPHHYGRRDLHVSNEVKDGAVRRASAGPDPGPKTVGPYKVLRRESIDGVKLYLDTKSKHGVQNDVETWLLFRASGTEPMLRLYCEADSAALANEVLDHAEDFVQEKATTAA